MAGFKKFQYQVDLAERIVKSLDDNDIAICAIPCGYGKTGIAYWLHKIYGKRSIILNHNRILVDQYDDLYHDLDDIGCVKGKSNYPCALDKSVASVEYAPCQFKNFRCFKQNNGECEYYALRKKFDRASLGITNYQMILSLLESDSYSRSDNELLICDECHNLDAILCEYKVVRVNQGFIQNLSKFADCILEFHDEELTNDIMSMLNHCEELYLTIDENNYHKMLDEFFVSVGILENMGVEILHQYNDEDIAKSGKLKETVLRLSELVSIIDRTKNKYMNYIKDRLSDIEYVYQDFKDGDNCSYSLTPIHVGNFFNETLSQICSKAILMSGTVVNLDNMRQTLGLEKRKTSYFDIPSLYDKKNRPILFCNTAGLNKSNSVPGSVEFKKIIEEMKSIIEYHAKKGESGVIFVPSYALANNIRESLEKFFKKMKITVFSNINSEESNTVLKQFCDTSVKKRVMISPSFEEGVNFNDDISRYQIIVKTPYLYLGDKRVKAKMERDKDWYETATMTRIIQSSARSVRNKKDYAVTYILDTNSYRLYNRMKKYCPNWFNEAVNEM